MIIGGKKYWYVETILDERSVRHRGRNVKEYLVKYLNHIEPEWQPSANLRELDALREYKAKKRAEEEIAKRQAEEPKRDRPARQTGRRGRN